MSENKNIDNFFKEHLAHFEVNPPDMAWDNIEAKLNEKKEKRRIVPFWLKFSGIAAILLIGFELYTTYFNNNSVVNHPIVNQQTTVPNHSKGKEVANSLTDSTINKEVVIQNLTKDKDKTDNIRSSNATLENKINTTLANKNIQNKGIAVLNNKSKASNSNKKRPSTKEIIASSNASLVSNNLSSNKTQNSIKTNLDSEKETKPSFLNTSIQEVITNRSNKTDVGATDLAIDKIPNNINSKTGLAISENTKTNAEEIKKIDSTKLAAVEPNVLEELLKEKENKITKIPKIDRWQVSPNIAPIFFSSLSNGSPLDQKLEVNQKNYGTNYSYGLTFNYSINKKYSIRTGVNSFSVDYDTKGIVFYQNANASKMQNLNPNLQGSLIQIDPLNNVNTSFGRIIEDKFEGTINQKIGYLEIPLEVSYKLVSKKFGLDVIGGLSTLFLNQNDVFLKSSGFNMKIGEASNLNMVHFSTNIGLGLKYSFLKKFDARIEPLFKYQLNTFSSGSGNFKPYIFGVYSGISYHF